MSLLRYSVSIHCIDVTRTARVAKKKAAAARAHLAPLSREAIVETALGLADREGLDAVSMRNVAAELDVGFMRFYGHVDSKEQLFELMVDAVYGELDLPPRNGDWRDALRLLAGSLRAAAKRHPWFVRLLGGRPNLGPNALAHNEAVLAALAFSDIDEAILAAQTVRSYAIGAIQSEAAILASGQDQEAFQDATWPYLEKMLATGRYPNIERVVREAKHHADMFERGLERVLAGLD